MKMVQFFNRIAMLISTSVLIEETCYRRAKVIRKAIKVGIVKTNGVFITRSCLAYLMFFYEIIIFFFIVVTLLAGVIAIFVFSFFLFYLFILFVC